MPRRSGSSSLAVSLVSRTSGSPPPDRLPEHQAAHDQHQHPEQGEKLLSVDSLGERSIPRARQGRPPPRRRRAAPFHPACYTVRDKVAGGAQRHRNGARADGDMGGGDADDIGQERDGQDRSASADEPKDESDQPARAGGKARCCDRERHASAS